MKFTTAVLATATLAAAVSAQGQQPMTISDLWCAEYHKSCREVSKLVCGGNHSYESRCYARFRVPANVCEQYSVDCFCITTGTTDERRNLESTFSLTGARTNGACNNAKSLPEPPKEDQPQPTDTKPNPTSNEPSKPSISPIGDKKPEGSATSLTAGKTIALVSSVAAALFFF
ncbi:hypothetical protein BGW42_006568 [Actinomortierella wolfii]|nr:hypothetical protein BGW42_006568 [Actinomortierella wolfii]